MNDSDDLLRVFQEEAQELLDKIAALTKEIPNVTGEELAENLQLLSMLTHNLKGAASTVDLVDIVNISHAIEDILDRLKTDNTTPEAETIDLFLEAITTMHLSLAGEDIVDRVEFVLGKLNVQSVEEPRDEKSQLQPEKEREKSAALKFENIRIDTSRFDRLMGFAGVLFESEARMEARHARWSGFVKELQRHIKQDANRARILSPFLYEAKSLLQKDRNDLLDFDRLVQEISEAMKQTRMVPLKNAESLWRKIVREAAYVSQKEVDFQVQVGEIELDKYVLDQLHDPLMHLLRNAVDHGIETAETRSKREKPPKGQIGIRAQVQGARLRFEISDDGQGVDLQAVFRSAVAKGLFETDDKKSEEQILDVLFYPGFTTAKNVSRLSGRGVGLDVVRSRVESLGGNVTVDRSPLFGGTTFVLAVPLSILSSLGLLVRLGETIYALPLEYVSRTMRIAANEIEYVDGKPLIPQGNAHPLRLAWLADIVGIKSSSESRMLQVAVLQRSDIQMALVVDEIVGQREFVTQALPWNFIDVPGVNGAIIQADGTVAISLDIPFLFEGARKAGKGQKPNGTIAPDGSIKKVLVVDDSMTSLVLGRNFLEAAGYKVSTAVDGAQAWKELQQKDFDLVVSDVKMPNMDGLELTRRIRQSPKHKSLPVILITSKANPADVAAGASAGADEYVIKGTFDQQTLIDLVGKYL